MPETKTTASTSVKDFVVLISLSAGILVVLVGIYVKANESSVEVARLTEVARSNGQQLTRLSSDFSVWKREVQADITSLKVSVEGLKVKNGNAQK